MVQKFLSFSGSRHLAPGCLSLQVAGQVLQKLGTAGAPLATGCCPSGLDFFIRASCAASLFPLSVFYSASQAPLALRARTLRMVAQSAALFSFPVSATFAHSGSWLSAFSAAAAGVPCFVFLPGVPGSALPLCRGVVSWQQVQICGANFWQPICKIIQQQLEF